MLQFTLVVILILLSRRWRRALREPSRPIRIDLNVYHHFPAGPGERQLDDVTIEDNLTVLPPNVVRLRR